MKVYFSIPIIVNAAALLFFPSLHLGETFPSYPLNLTFILPFQILSVCFLFEMSDIM